MLTLPVCVHRPLLVAERHDVLALDRGAQVDGPWRHPLAGLLLHAALERLGKRWSFIFHWHWGSQPSDSATACSILTSMTLLTLPNLTPVTSLLDEVSATAGRRLKYL